MAVGGVFLYEFRHEPTNMLPRRTLSFVHQANLGAVLLIPNRWPLLRRLSRLFRLGGVRLLEQLIGLRELPFGLVIADQRVE